MIYHSCLPGCSHETRKRMETLIGAFRVSRSPSKRRRGQSGKRGSSPLKTSCQAPNSAAAELLLHSFENSPSAVNWSENNNYTFIQELYNDPGFKHFVVKTFQKVKADPKNQVTRNRQNDHHEFNSGDLYFALHGVSIQYSLIKLPNGAGAMTVTVTDKYNFEHAKSTWDTLKKEGPLKVIGKNLGNFAERLQKAGMIHEFPFSAQIDYYFGVNGQLLPLSPPPSPGGGSKPPSSPLPTPTPTPPPSSTTLAQDQTLVQMITTAVVNPNKPLPPTPPPSSDPAEVTFLLDVADNAFYGPIKPPPAFAITNLINGANNGSVPVDVIAQVLYYISVLFGPLGGTYGVSATYSVGSFYVDIADQADAQDEGPLVSDLSGWGIANVTGSLQLGEESQQFLDSFDGPTLVAIATGGDYGVSEFDDLGADITYDLFS